MCSLPAYQPLLARKYEKPAGRPQVIVAIFLLSIFHCYDNLRKHKIEKRFKLRNNPTASAFSLSSFDICFHCISGGASQTKYFVPLVFSMAGLCPLNVKVARCVCVCVC